MFPTPRLARFSRRVPLAGAEEVNAAVEAACAAFPDWRRTPPEDRIQPLFKLKMLLEENIEDLSRTITRENGKTLSEARAEFRRAIENVEVACGIPMMMQGYNLEDVASRHRRGDDSPAAGRRRGNHAVQFSRDDPLLVSALRRRHRKHPRPQALRARANDDAARLRAA